VLLIHTIRAVIRALRVTKMATPITTSLDLVELKSPFSGILPAKTWTDQQPNTISEVAQIYTVIVTCNTDKCFLKVTH